MEWHVKQIFNQLCLGLGIALDGSQGLFCLLGVKGAGTEQS
ncbi:MAG TPA: hypothetical protein V6C63_06710 [Allocoleopsis sp.]